MKCVSTKARSKNAWGSLNSAPTPDVCGQRIAIGTSWSCASRQALTSDSRRAPSRSLRNAMSLPRAIGDYRAIASWWMYQSSKRENSGKRRT